MMTQKCHVKGLILLPLEVTLKKRLMVKVKPRFLV